MSELYEALRRLELEKSQPGTIPCEPVRAAEVLTSLVVEPMESEVTRSLTVQPSLTNRLITLTEPRSLGAEKFRALATRLENIRKQQELKSLQVSSSVVNEGKTFVAGNLAVTLAKCFGFRTLLIEGDLHRPALASLFGFGELRGMTHWWAQESEEIDTFLHRINDMPLWMLTAGQIHDQPSDILQSSRFTDAFAQLSRRYDWVIVDSTPMQPIIDANLWSRLVDRTLLVVREGVAPVKALTRGLQALDSLKLVGIVINEASECDHSSYGGMYYSSRK